MMGRQLAVGVCAAALASLLGHVAHPAGPKECWNAATRHDERGTLRHCRPVAEQGDPHAQYLVGLMYHHSEANPVEGAKWYRLSAEQGYVEAQYALGLVYYTGAGAPKDYIRALMWVHLAALQGNKNALRTRVLIEKQMAPADISEARRLAREGSAMHNEK